MSWDITLKQKKMIQEEVADVGNYTSNVANMYSESMGFSIRDFDGVKASEIIKVLRQGILKMESDPDKYKEMNPKNGWGNYDGALQYLKDLLQACEEYPNSTVEVN